MKRQLAFIYGVAADFVALVTILYAIGFVGDFIVPKTIDSGGQAVSLRQALMINVALLGLFAVQHSGMARRGFKKVWTRLVAPPVERSTYVWFSSLALVLLYWFWQPMPAVVWEVESPIGAGVLWALFGLGWLLLFTSIQLIDRGELFGVKQVQAYLERRNPEPIPFKTPFLYRLVRHPLYLGFFFAFWATPAMTLGHLLFALATTGYILIAIQLEERDLVHTFGEKYRAYQQQVPMVLPLGRRTSRTPPGRSAMRKQP